MTRKNRHSQRRQAQKKRFQPRKAVDQLTETNSPKNQAQVQKLLAQKKARIQQQKATATSSSPPASINSPVSILEQLEPILDIWGPLSEAPIEEQLEVVLRLSLLTPDPIIVRSRIAYRLQGLDLALPSILQQPIEGPVDVPISPDRKIGALIELLKDQQLFPALYLVGQLFSDEALKNKHWELTPDHYLTLVNHLITSYQDNTEFKYWIEQRFIYHQSISHYHFFGPQKLIQLWDLFLKIQSPQQITEQGYSPLSLLCTHLCDPIYTQKSFFIETDDRKPLIKWLLNPGKVSPNTKDSIDQWSPLDEICGIAHSVDPKSSLATFTEQDREEILYLLIDHGALIKKEEPRSSLKLVLKIIHDPMRTGRLIVYFAKHGDDQSDLSDLAEEMIQAGQRLDPKVVKFLLSTGRLQKFLTKFVTAFLNNRPQACDQILDFLGGEFTLPLQNLLTVMAQPRSKVMKTLDVFSVKPCQSQTHQMSDCVRIAKKFQTKNEQQITSRDYQCSICWDDLDGQVVKGCPNGHYFHQGCLGDWLSKDQICPTCRVPLGSQETGWTRLPIISSTEKKTRADAQAKLEQAAIQAAEKAAQKEKVTQELAI